MTEYAAPLCTIIAGPNGAGKSTVVQDLNSPGEFVNADEYSRRINPFHPKYAALMAAGKEVLDRLHTLIAHQQSFHYETTLSSHQALSLMANARQAGYQVNLVFLLLETPALNIARNDDDNIRQHKSGPNSSYSHQ